MEKISTRAEVMELCRRWQAEGLGVGFTSGVFDLLHAGHVDYLLQAKEHCDRLIVAINADASVRANKGPSRPVVQDVKRALLVGALKPVDAVFVFEELNNNRNMELLRPDVYIKAGDYAKAKLSSAKIIESYGGRVQLIPLKFSTSTSETIEHIVARCAPSFEAQAQDSTPRPTVFLDRDGVICDHIEYLHEPDKFKLTPGCAKALCELRSAGYRLVVVTNQPGIALGYFTHEDFYAVNREMFRQFKEQGVVVDRIYYCPHGESDACTCRKPKPGMLLKAGESLKIDFAKSWMIGDRESDIQAGRGAGVKSILITPVEAVTQADHIVLDLQAAAEYILRPSGKTI